MVPGRACEFNVRCVGWWREIFFEPCLRRRGEVAGSKADMLLENSAGTWLDKRY